MWWTRCDYLEWMYQDRDMHHQMRHAQRVLHAERFSLLRAPEIAPYYREAVASKRN
jgi:hypothetical protein